MTDARHIFLSYRSIEVDFALKLAADLKNAGVRLWMDRLDGIRGGDDWRMQIENALSPDQCALMIVVLSPDYLTADYCLKELARADRLKIPLLPILLYPVPNMPMELERIQYIPFCGVDRSGRLERTWHVDALYTERLRQLLDAIPAAQKDRIPDAETRYLTTLIAEMEAAQGVLQYLALSGQMEEARPALPPIDEWGYEELIQSTFHTASGVPGMREERIPVTNITEVVNKHSRFVLIGESANSNTLNRWRASLSSAFMVSPLLLLIYTFCSERRFRYS